MTARQTPAVACAATSCVLVRAVLDDAMDLGLGDAFLNEDLVEMLGFADDLMLEEPA